MNEVEEGAENAQATEPSPQDFLKKHVRGIPREKMQEKKVYYGFKYRDLKDFINSIIGQYQGVESPDLLAKISELELKTQTLQSQKEAMGKELEEAKSSPDDAPDPAALQELQEKLNAAEAEKTQLATAAEEAGGSVDEHQKKAQDLSAELAALKEDYGKLEKESEFLENEMQKLDEANKALMQERDTLQGELDRLLEEKETTAEAFAKERGDLEEKISGMEQIIASSKDAQKLLEMQKEFERYKWLLQAYENAVAEAVDVEPQPDPE
ncbi:MAG: hypothetical protein ACYTFG_15250, partial [Planctomycetota bacterium]